jgi:lipoprotein-anchoring transpeptidase ErfK/SrfK
MNRLAFPFIVALLAAVAAVSALSSAASSATSAASTKQAAVETKFPAAGELTVHSVPVRRQPNPNASVIKVMHDFRSDFRVQEILAVRRATGSDGADWYRISIPMRPNGTYGWIPASKVSLAPTISQIVVHRGSRTIDIYWHGKRRVHAIAAVGAPSMPTPLGKYYVAARFVPQNDPFLGVFAVETSAYSSLPNWPGGGVVGIHGTNEPWLLGQPVSHGCIRVANQTALALKRFAPLGTPIRITK